MAKDDKKTTAARPVPSSTQPAGPDHKGLKVTSRPASFRRGGHTFTGEAKTIPLDQLTEAQAVAIHEDPNLVCQVVDIDPPEQAADSKQ
jgi:hypothetical protein